MSYSADMALGTIDQYSSVSNKNDTQNDNNKLQLKRVFNLIEASEIIGVGPDTVRRLIREGKLRKLPIRHIKISAVEMNRFLSEGGGKRKSASI